MENPDTHNNAVRVIDQALVEHYNDVQNGVIGLSQARRIHDALFEAGYLTEASQKHAIDWSVQDRNEEIELRKLALQELIAYDQELGL